MLFNLLSLLERLASSKGAQAARREKLLSLLASLKGALEHMAQGNLDFSAAAVEFTNATSDFLSSHKLLAPGRCEPMERLSAMLEAVSTHSKHGHLSNEQALRLLTQVNAVLEVLK